MQAFDLDDEYRTIEVLQSERTNPARQAFIGSLSTRATKSLVGASLSG
jgi:hypothetical protein